jgi:pimeloyl-ACP methyl ester carboxylesterase
VVLLFIYPAFERKGRIFARIRKNFENYLIFQPSRLRAKRIKRGLLKNINPQRFINPEGIKLYAWYIKPQGDKPVFLHLHGQAESILSHQEIALACLERGYGLFMLSYRGHYKSGGIPSERGLYNDAKAALIQLKKMGIESDKIILWGHSLGSAIALNTAIYNKVLGVIIQSPIKEIKSAAVDIYNFYCTRINLKMLARYAKKHIYQIRFIQKLDNMSKIKAVKCPILITHSRKDRVAPCTNAIDLARQNPLASVFISERGNHWDSEWCLNKVFEFAKSLEYNEDVKREKEKGKRF